MRDSLYDKIAQAQGYKNTKEMLQDLYTTKGVSQTMIANLIGCSIPTVKTLRQQYGINNKSKILTPSLIIPKKILSSCTCAQLATKYGISKSHAWRLKKEVGEIKVDRSLPHSLDF